MTIDLGTCIIDGCGLPAMAVVSVVMVTDQAAEYPTCPRHLDTTVARAQDATHDQMVLQDGALSDWWAEVNPEPEPEQRTESGALLEEDGDTVLPSEDVTTPPEVDLTTAAPTAGNEP